MNKIEKIKYVGDYNYFIQFDDGVQGVVDFSNYLSRGVFKQLVDLHLFKQANIQGGTITWPNELDIAPETLYEKCESSEVSSSGLST